MVSAPQEPTLEWEGFPRSKGEGAANVAGKTFLSCAGGVGNCGGAFCPIVLVVWLGVCGVASGVGAVVGAAQAPSAEVGQSYVTTLSDAAQPRTAEEQLRRRVEASALANGRQLAAVPAAPGQDATRSRDYRALAASGVDTVLEVGFTKVGTEGIGSSNILMLFMNARVRLVSTADNTEFYSADYEFDGLQTLSGWLANRGEAVSDNLRAGYEALGSDIYDSVFLLYPFPDRKPHDDPNGRWAYGTMPVSPPLSTSTFSRSAATVESLRPALSWQTFPRPSDMQAAPEEMRRVKNVRYDLLIGRAQGGHIEIAYRRQGIPANVHTIETSLSPKTHYLWRVRARFELDGRERVTEWSSVWPPPIPPRCEEMATLSARSVRCWYRFDTP